MNELIVEDYTGYNVKDYGYKEDNALSERYCC